MNTNPLKFIKDRIVAGRKMDEAFYELALQEFRSGSVRPGLMAKAIAECNGDELKARAAYVRLLATALRDDCYVALRSEEEQARSTKRNQTQHEAVKSKKSEDAKQNASTASPQEDSLNILKIVVIIILLAG